MLYLSSSLLFEINVPLLANVQSGYSPQFEIAAISLLSAKLQLASALLPSHNLVIRFFTAV